MDATLLATSLSAASAIAVATITYALTKRREREIEWSKFKLEHYREYIAALSGITEWSVSPENQRRYADAANNLSLVAPSNVLRAFYALQDEIRYNNPDKTQEGHDARLSVLFRAIRRDIQPSPPDDGNFIFRIFDVPPPSPERTKASPRDRAGCSAGG